MQVQSAKKQAEPEVSIFQQQLQIPTEFGQMVTELQVLKISILHMNFPKISF